MDNQFNNFVFILDVLYIDDEEDIKLLKREIKGFLKRIKKDKRRLLAYICTEPVKKLEVKE